ncbi:MAG TPA: TetR family transcriptional regulator [Lacipirellulaceae bacterium]|jgi:TetR/AcrR family transcriptional regulator|nr:TetR family transcriptional regulator [Lacipirellulaceae bacterium]
MADERTRDSESTRNAVLCAAERLFAENGFAATSVRDISQVSGVSHPLIHHHFGGKNDLYAAVKRRLVEDYARRFPNAAKAANRPLNVRAEMRRLMKYIGGNPMMLRLAARTRLEGDHQAWPGEPAVLDMLTRRIKFSQQRGLICQDISAEHLSIMLLGLVYFWLERREYLAYRFGKRINDADYLRQAIGLLERGIEPRGKRNSAADCREKSE